MGIFLHYYAMPQDAGFTVPGMGIPFPARLHPAADRTGAQAMAWAREAAL